MKIGIWSVMLACTFLGTPVGAQMPTPTELTGYRRTPSYEKTIDYLRELERKSNQIHLDVFGKTPLGRSMYVVVVSKDRAFDPAAAHRTGKLVLFIQNGIHAGEIDGKDASLELIRDLTVTGNRSSLLDHVILVIVPVFNVDGHELTSPYNRINQNGPDSMGFRTTSQNYNLNRDYMKLDAPEMRAWVGLWNAWNPDFLIDNHVTDGADFQYAITYTISRHDNTAPEIAAWCRDRFVPDVTLRMEKSGEPLFPYVTTAGKTLLSGIVDWVETPRFSTGYAGMRNRPGLLVETHMLKDYARRVHANYLLMVAVLELLNEHPEELQKAVSLADLHSRLGLETRLALDFKRDSVADTVDFLGYAYDSLQSEITGGTWIRYDTTKKVTLRVPYLGRMHPALEVDVPWAYVIPPQWTDVILRLKQHGVEMQRLKKAATIQVARDRLFHVSWEAKPFEGHHQVSCSTLTEVAQITYPEGSVVVPTKQVRRRLVVHALEPLGPDSFLRWGFFDTILEQKEYAEDYVAEKLAAQMLNDSPGLRPEYDSLVASDTAFAASATARLDFFYKRSPYAEPMFNVYPVGRIQVETPLELTDPE